MVMTTMLIMTMLMMTMLIIATRWAQWLWTWRATWQVQLPLGASLENGEEEWGNIIAIVIIVIIVIIVTIAIIIIAIIVIVNIIITGKQGEG